MFEVERDCFLADIRGDEIAAPVIIGHAAANVAVRIARQAAVRLGRLDADDAPAELGEAQRRRWQRQCLLQTENGTRRHAEAIQVGGCEFECRAR